MGFKIALGLVCVLAAGAVWIYRKQQEIAHVDAIALGDIKPPVYMTDADGNRLKADERLEREARAKRLRIAERVAEAKLEPAERMRRRAARAGVTR